MKSIAMFITKQGNNVKLFHQAYEKECIQDRCKVEKCLNNNAGIDDSF